MKKQILLFGYLTGFNAISVGQESMREPLITDRPDQTESAFIVPAGFFQIETGFLFGRHETNSFTEDNLNLFTTLLRYGINQHFELRLGTSYLMHETSGWANDVQTSGLTPVTAGMKFKMVEEMGLVPEMAFLAIVTLPHSGKEEFSPEYTATEFRFAAEYTFSDWLGMGINLGGAWDGSSVKPAGIYSLVLGADVGGRTGLFLEGYGELPQGTQPDHRLDGGLTYLVKHNLQLDASAGVGLSEISPDFFVNAGLSWRINNKKN